MQTSGTALTGFSTFTGKPSFGKMMKACPAPMASALAAASAVSPWSLPDLRTRRAEEASQNASPKRSRGLYPGQRLVQVLHGLDEVGLAR